ncbi:MAG TPA: trigger factor [Candidatus Moranbacteria bacterium]|nr:trigger factor [Candidatus Moranbacteria bacterium]
MIKKLPKSRIEIKITVPREDWEKHLDKAAAEVSEEIKFEGFRPGKAPRKMVEQKIGKGPVLNAAAEKAVQKSYVDFVTAEKLEVIGSPEVEIEKIEEGFDLEFVARVAVMPKIEIKDSYKKDIKKVNEANKDKSSEPTEDEVLLELEKLANSRVKLVTVAREAKNNDSVEIDFAVTVNGVPIEGGTSKNHPLVIGKGVFIPGFEDNLIGMKEGEEKEFELEFPKEYHKKERAGQKAVFKVKVNLVQERQIPAVDDEFAKSLGKFETLEALKKNMKDGMAEESKQKMKDKQRSEYIEKIIENSKVELPEVLVRQEIHTMLHEFDQQLQGMGMTVDTYLAQLKKDKKELEKDWEPQAEKRVKSALALQEIAKLEEINIDTKEIEEEMNKTLQYYKNVKNMEKNIDMERLYNFTKGNMENERVFEFLERL